MVTRRDICERARYYERLGTRWRHQGRNERGIDCVGLLIVIARDLRLVEPDWDYNNYPRKSHPITFLEKFHEFMDRLPTKASARPGDALIITAGLSVSHTGIIMPPDRGWPTFIHASAAFKKVVEAPLTGWAKNARIAFAFKGIEDD